MRRADERRSASHQDQQFHQVVVGRIAGRLQDEDVFAAHILMHLDIDFLVREALDRAICQGKFEVAGDGLGEGSVRVAGHQLHGRDPVSTGPGDPRDHPVSRAALASPLRDSQRNKWMTGEMGRDSRQADDGDLAAGLAALVGGVAMGEIAVGMGIGAAADRARRCVTPAAAVRRRRSRAGRNARAPLLRRREMPPAIGPQLGEVLHEMGADLVVLARDRRADGGDDAGWIGAELHHGGDRIADDAVDRAAPAGMGRADDAGLRVGEQDRACSRRSGCPAPCTGRWVTMASASIGTSSTGPLGERCARGWNGPA